MGEPDHLQIAPSDSVKLLDLNQLVETYRKAMANADEHGVFTSESAVSQTLAAEAPGIDT